MCLLPILILLELNKHFDTIHDINFFTRIFLHTPSDNNTCMPDRDQHDPCDDDVYSKCGRHLPDSRAEPGFSVPHNEPGSELWDGGALALPQVLVPVRVWLGVVGTLHGVDDFINVVPSSPEVGGCRHLHDDEGDDVKDQEDGRGTEGTF